MFAELARRVYGRSTRSLHLSRVRAFVRRWIHAHNECAPSSVRWRIRDENRGRMRRLPHRSRCGYSRVESCGIELDDDDGEGCRSSSSLSSFSFSLPLSFCLCLRSLSTTWRNAFLRVTSCTKHAPFVEGSNPYGHLHRSHGVDTAIASGQLTTWVREHECHSASRCTMRHTAAT